MTKVQIFTDKNQQGFLGFPNAVKANGLVFTSGVRSKPKKQKDRNFSGIPQEYREKEQRFSLVDEFEGKVCYDAAHTHAALQDLLERCGSDSTQILRQHMWQRDKRFFPAYENIRKKVQTVPAPSSGLGVEYVFGDREGSIGLDAIAVCPNESSLYPQREVIAKLDNKKLPSAGFYSQAVKTGDLVFTAGHIPIKTSTAGMPVVTSFNDIPVEGRFLATGRSHPDSRDGPIAAQAWYTYNELKRTLENHDVKLSDTINSTVYLTDIRDFPVFHRIHTHFFPENGPALTVIGFSEVGHRGCLIEIELTAVKTLNKSKIKRVDWPVKPPFNAPAATITDNLIFLSGICGLKEDGTIFTSEQNSIEINFPDTITQLLTVDSELVGQTWYALNIISEISKKAGSSIDNLLKISVYLKDEKDFEIFQKIFNSLVLKENFPALECIIIPNPGPTEHARIQIEAIASKI